MQRIQMNEAENKAKSREINDRTVVEWQGRGTMLLLACPDTQFLKFDCEPQGGHTTSGVGALESQESGLSIDTSFA